MQYVNKQNYLKNTNYIQHDMNTEQQTYKLRV